MIDNGLCNLRHLLAGAQDGDYLSSLCSIADHRLYKIVKWCKSLPLFKNIQVKSCQTTWPFVSFFLFVDSSTFSPLHVMPDWKMMVDSIRVPYINGLVFFRCLMQIDDQISLLINTWCELLLFACCYRSLTAPGEIRISHGKAITLE